MPNFPSIGHDVDDAFMAIVDPASVTHPLPADGQSPWGDTFRLWSGDVEDSLNALEAATDQLGDDVTAAEVDINQLQADVAALQATPATTPRHALGYTTASLANNTAEVGLLSPGVDVVQALIVTTNVAARVRVYASVAARTADLARPAGTDPTGNHGVLLDVQTIAGALTWPLTPCPTLYAAAAGGQLPIAVTNVSGGAAAVVVALTVKDI